MSTQGNAARIACIGECMIELSGVDFATGRARVAFAGDTANTAIYLARLGCGVSYVTNLGTDDFSAQMRAMFAAEGVDCHLVGTHPTRLPGLYSIALDAAGERSFGYWREASAARTLFADIGASLSDLDQFPVIYLSGITLAILPPAIRTDLIAHLSKLRSAGRQIVFDSNYRPRLWPDAASARAAFAAMWAVTTLGLPSFDDEERLYPGIDQGGVLDRIAGLGVPEIVLKNGASGQVIRAEGSDTQMAPARAPIVVDTTGAGDSFNAGYLAARLQGMSALKAAEAGHLLAATVIGHPGGVINRNAMPG